MTQLSFLRLILLLKRVLRWHRSPRGRRDVGLQLGALQTCRQVKRSKRSVISRQLWNFPSKKWGQLKPPKSYRALVVMPPLPWVQQFSLPLTLWSHYILNQHVQQFSRLWFRFPAQRIVICALTNILPHMEPGTSVSDAMSESVRSARRESTTLFPISGCVTSARTRG